MSAKPEILMRIPLEYEEEILNYLAKLQEKKTIKITTAPEPEAHEPVSAGFSEALPEKEKVYQHEDIDHLLMVYSNQTGDEKQNGRAKHVNGKGFNKADAAILTSLAEFYLKNKYLYRSDMQTVSRRIRKYHAQWGE